MRIVERDGAISVDSRLCASDQAMLELPCGWIRALVVFVVVCREICEFRLRTACEKAKCSVAVLP